MTVVDFAKASLKIRMVLPPVAVSHRPSRMTLKEHGLLMEDLLGTFNLVCLSDVHIVQGKRRVWDKMWDFRMRHHQPTPGETEGFSLRI